MTADQWGNLAGLAGTVILIFPAVKATKIFFLAERTKDLLGQIPREQGKLAEWTDQVHQDIKALPTEWNRGDVARLFGGIALTGLSDLLPLLRSWSWLS